MRPGSTLSVQLPGNALTVNSNLTLAGTLNITDAGGFAPGTYTLITYNGSLTNNGLTIGTVPNAAYGYLLDTNTTGQVKLLVVSSPWVAWQLQHFSCTNCSQAAATANPSGDGLANLIKYALGLDPLTATNSLFQFDRVATNGYTYLRLSTPRDSNVTDVDIEGLSTGTLTHWTNNVVIELDTATIFRVRDGEPIETNSQRFLKLKFSMP